MIEHNDVRPSEMYCAMNWGLGISPASLQPPRLLRCRFPAAGQISKGSSAQQRFQRPSWEEVPRPAGTEGPPTQRRGSHPWAAVPHTVRAPGEPWVDCRPQTGAAVARHHRHDGPVHAYSSSCVSHHPCMAQKIGSSAEQRNRKGWQGLLGMWHAWAAHMTRNQPCLRQKK